MIATTMRRSSRIIGLPSGLTTLDLFANRNVGVGPLLAAPRASFRSPSHRLDLEQCSQQLLASSAATLDVFEGVIPTRIGVHTASQLPRTLTQLGLFEVDVHALHAIPPRMEKLELVFKKSRRKWDLGQRSNSRMDRYVHSVSITSCDLPYLANSLTSSQLVVG